MTARAKRGFSRREFGLTAIGGAAAAALASCGGSGGSSIDAAAGGGDGGATGADATPVADGDGTCTLYPQETEGPYYLDLNDLRADITEGKAGATLTLVLKVVSAGGCAPLEDVAVDIWHCDALGVYSGYPGQPGGVDTTGQTFLRGTQITDANGTVQFTTIYPGWYNGRTTHVHFKVHVSGTSEATSQLFFAEDVTTAVYQTAPYSTHGAKDTSNASDMVYAGGTQPPLLVLSGDAASGFVGTMTITVA